MEISPRELRDTEIKDGMRGYNKDEVNDLLERAAATIEERETRLNQLTDRLQSAQTEAGRTRETEDVLHRTLLLAQRAADEAVAEATAKARQMLDDADIQARRLVADSEAEARRKGESERRRLEEEILDLASRRDALLADVEALTRFEAEYRERMVRALEADLSALRSRPTTAPGTRPEPTEVEMPSLSDVDEEPSVATQQPSAAIDAAPSAPVTPPAPAPAPAPVAPVAPVASSAPPKDVATGGAPTHEVDVRTLFEQAKPAIVTDDETMATRAAAAAARPPEPARPNTPPQPIDLLSNDGADADVLDDDAFFATLRDAVHDEAPLGPRDDEVAGDQRFFDQDADRGSFRDVFRRRR